MTCAHCCQNCEPGKGEDMPFDIWKQYCDMEEMATLGGGEPTLHPEFWKFLCYALGRCDYVWLATNGSQTQIALTLALMVKGIEKLSVELSLDEYHDPIDPEVEWAFRQLPHAIRTISETVAFDRGRPFIVGQDPIKAGRCDWGREGECVCNDMQLYPDGNIRYCGCDDSPWIGTIEDWMYPEFECWIQAKQDEEELERFSGKELK